ncbi:hypothetical protein SAMN05216388_10259 [Halorientalis persicus]|uniref:Uncharacterized protein n=1 Tax=Halorientalis persicus TaxID=1367881 RepID=A0A1H8U0L0_9EURY|nr:hypothetical protein [Halorientalis persicus]SEO96802.1 hypothetical protein SAMN05216388_10259 [Halorientalis persicus]
MSESESNSDPPTEFADPGIDSNPEQDGTQAEFNQSGELTKKEQIRMSLEDHGVDIPRQRGESQVEQEKASEFGVDDRSTDSGPTGEETEQQSLFASSDDQQLTLGGEQASQQFMFDD